MNGCHQITWQIDRQVARICKSRCSKNKTVLFGVLSRNDTVDDTRRPSSTPDRSYVNEVFFFVFILFSVIILRCVRCIARLTQRIYTEKE